MLHLCEIISFKLCAILCEQIWVLVMHNHGYSHISTNGVLKQSLHNKQEAT